MTRYEELVDILARLYNCADPSRTLVQRLCDNFIDPSGKLLGEVRRAARKLK